MKHSVLSPTRQDLTVHGFHESATAQWNLGSPQLIEHAIRRQEGHLADVGALVVKTGQFTGRSPKDKYIVRDERTDGSIGWGSVNQAMSEETFDRLYARLMTAWDGDELFAQDCFAGADPAFRLPIRVITQRAWHALFARNLFLRPSSIEIEEHQPEFTILFAPTFGADPERDGTHSKTCIAISFKRRAVIIAGTEYAGEVKKSVFTILNYLLPERDVFPMHCSANAGADGRVALFFGLSGTGKTTLSADASRRLIGDDEHGWSSAGVFNFEGGCYAKCIRLSKEREPQIWNAVRYGTLLENVAMDAKTRTLDFDSEELTENTRAAYPIEFIDNAQIPGVGGHPSHIVFLTADAFGVLPPISRLTPEQALYHFLSGYTAKLAGTERGLGKEPSATFSECFGSPFLPRPALVYARMLGERMRRQNVNCYLVNTGWIGGPYGIGHRMHLPDTRAMVDAAIEGKLDSVPTTPDPVFGLHVPQSCPNVAPSILNARSQWLDPQTYDRAAEQLKTRFEKNFTKFGPEGAELIRSAATSRL